METDALLPMKETGLTFTNAKVKTTKHFARVDNIVFNVPEATTTLNAPTTTTTITAKAGQTTSVYKNKDDIFPGWTMQLVRGNVPAVAEGAVPINATLTIGENVRLQMEILARKLHPFREIGSAAVAHKITTLNINQNLDFLPGIKASRYRLPIAPTGEKRNVTLTATVYYEVDETSGEKWTEVFQDNLARQLSAACYYWNEDGKQLSQKFTLPVGYLTASPRIGVDSRGPITRELTFKGVPASDTAPDEIEIAIVA